jgi:hypothetical protein
MLRPSQKHKNKTKQNQVTVLTDGNRSFAILTPFNCTIFGYSAAELDFK